jgi:hypothetical protein
VLDSAGKSRSAKSAEELLGAMGQEDHPEGDPDDE